MVRKLIPAVALVVLALLSGCAKVPMADAQLDTQAKRFTPTPGTASIYVYRNEGFGAAVRMDLLLDGKLVGETAAQTYAALSVAPGPHTLSGKAENTSTIEVQAEEGKNYFIWQEVKMGILMARNKLQKVDAITGRNGVMECQLIKAQN